MQSEKKMNLVGRLTVAQDIIINVKDDLKLESDKLPETDTLGKLERTYLANKLCDVALSLGKAKISILSVENELQEKYGGL
jgi:hypothetical protein